MREDYPEDCGLMYGKLSEALGVSPISNPLFNII